MARRIKIIHTGEWHTRRTKVVDAETGEDIRGVKRVEITLDAVDGASAILYIEGLELEIEIDTEEVSGS